MASIQMLHLLTKGSEFQWQHDRPYDWKEDAACAFLPHTMFEYAVADDPIAEGLTESELHDLNETNFQAAEKHCNRCPVWHLCYQEAEPQDFRETVRAGLVPLRHLGKSKPYVLKKPGRPRKEVDTSKPCPNGHEGEWRNRSDRTNSVYCKGCLRKSQRGARATRVKNDPTKPCKNGHSIDEWRRYKGEKSWHCAACKREKRGVKAARKVDPTKPCVNNHDPSWWFQEARKDRLYWRCRECKRSQQRESWLKGLGDRLEA